MATDCRTFWPRWPSSTAYTYIIVTHNEVCTVLPCVLQVWWVWTWHALLPARPTRRRGCSRVTWTWWSFMTASPPTSCSPMRPWCVGVGVGVGVSVGGCVCSTYRKGRSCAWHVYMHIHTYIHTYIHVRHFSHSGTIVCESVKPYQ